MSDSITLQVSSDEADAVLNALNYFAYALGADECQTLIGLEQEKVQSLHDRLRRMHRQQD